MALNMNNRRASFLQIKDLNKQDNLCKKYFLTSNHKKRQCSRHNEGKNCAKKMEPTTPSIKKGQHGRIPTVPHKVYPWTIVVIYWCVVR